MAYHAFADIGIDHYNLWSFFLKANLASIHRTPEAHVQAVVWVRDAS